ncbi:hypothetical protein [Bradyrhizobium sp. I71]|uniref:hypothetical protein n=1 Tax=Bradyrhizobium sp. I71 TaxID=2590772 RepID=UPI001EF80E82|nr:hypothetical protein [Bradyrhizobium sp. I71]ULK99705.1 hypothetical protein FJV43_08215 [Bradyrhizobium sp. I71]
MVNYGYDREGGEAGAHAVLAFADRPTAISATNHLVAIRDQSRRGTCRPRGLLDSGKSDAI